MKEGFSGRMLLRLDPALHRRLAVRAREHRVSINGLCAGLLEQGLQRQGAEPWWADQGKRIVDVLRRRFGTALVGVAIFGSQVQGTATDDSDVDFLIVLENEEPIRRTLYGWWDSAVRWEGRAEASPQFVHLPANVAEAGGIWLEAAVASEIIWERGRTLSSMLAKLRAEITSGAVRRFWNNGQPYWVRGEDAEQRSGT